LSEFSSSAYLTDTHLSRLKRIPQLPRTEPATLLEDLLPDLPPETVQMARAFNACVRAKTGKTPGRLWRGVC